MLQRLEGVDRRFGNWSMHLLDSAARADEIERLFDDASAGSHPAAAGSLLDAIAADARWHRADDMAP